MPLSVSWLRAVRLTGLLLAALLAVPSATWAAESESGQAGPAAPDGSADKQADRAIALLKEALALGTSGEALDRLYVDAVVSCRNARRLNDAVQFNEQSLVFRSSFYGKSHKYLGALSSLADLCLATKDHVRARVVFDELVMLRRQLLGPDAFATVQAETTLGMMLVGANEHARALDLCSHAYKASVFHGEDGTGRTAPGPGQSPGSRQGSVNGGDPQTRIGPVRGEASGVVIAQRSGVQIHLASGGRSRFVTAFHRESWT